jgi:hypothetical protein
MQEDKTLCPQEAPQFLPQEICNEMGTTETTRQSNQVYSPMQYPHGFGIAKIYQNANIDLLSNTD